MSGVPDATTALASVAMPGGSSELRSFALTPCPADGGWLRVEASGICGTDVSLLSNGLEAPCILGHHVVGQLAALGDSAKSRWSVDLGDRVAVEEYLPCGRCPSCRTDRYRLCPETDLWRGGRRVGLVPIDKPPALWGGNAQFMYLPPNAVLHAIPEALPPDVAVWTLPLANALDWVLGAGELQRGDTVLILGPGYHGLACVVAALSAGAPRVIVCGLETDGYRLELAAALGAVPLSQDPGLRDAVSRLTDGRMADVVLDLTPSGPQVVAQAVTLLGQGGRLVLAGAKTPPAASVDTASLIRLTATLRGVRGRAPHRVRESIDVLASGECGLERIPTADVSLTDTGPMLSRLARGDGPQTPHVVVRPWFSA